MERVAPAVKDLTEEEISGTDQWHQKFTLFMPGDPGDRATVQSHRDQARSLGPAGPHRALKNAQERPLHGQRLRSALCVTTRSREYTAG
jgi:hypothetical protein